VTVDISQIICERNETVNKIRIISNHKFNESLLLTKKKGSLNT